MKNKGNKGNKGNKSHYLYATYYSMIARCYNEKNKSYKYYGGKGVKVCDSWLGIDGFRNFIESMGDRPKSMTLDRINGSLLYSKETCKWSTKHEQQWNLSSNNKIIGVYFDSKKNKRRAEIDIKKVSYRGKWHSNIQDAQIDRKNFEKLI